VKAALQGALPKVVQNRVGDIVDADGGWSPDWDLIEETKSMEGGGSKLAFDVANLTRTKSKTNKGWQDIADPRADLLRAFHKSADEVAILRACQTAVKKHDGMCQGFDESSPDKVRALKRFEKLREAVGKEWDLDEKAYSSTSDTAWWPTTWSEDMIQAIRMMPTLANLFRSFTVPSTNPWNYPVQPQAPLAFIGAMQGLDQGQLMPAVNAGAQNVTFETNPIGARSVISEKFQFGSNVDITAEVGTQLSRGLAEGSDMAFFNGQKGALPHFDGASVTWSNDVRMLQNGLRKFAFDNNLNYDVLSGSQTFGLKSLQSIRQKMLPRYRQDFSRLMWITTDAVRGYIMTDSAFTSLQTVYAITERLATLVTGQLGMLLGSPVVVTPAASETMNATGYDGRTWSSVLTQDPTGTLTGTYTQSILMCAHRDAWGFAQFNGPRITAEYDPQRLQFVLTASQYIDFQPLFGAQACLGCGINIPVTPSS
jgi:HK97 family phage major capsid protein